MANQDRKRILLVDDDPRIRTLVRTTFSASDYEFLEAEDGISALDLAVQERPDLFIFDWRLPGLSGIELVRAVRAIEELSATPIIMLTARGSEEDIEAARREGAHYYLTKPFSPLELLDAIERTLGAPQSW